MTPLDRCARTLFVLAITLQAAFVAWSHFAVSAQVAAQELPSCGSGEYEETLTKCDQGIALPWKGTPSFSCTSGTVSDATISIYHDGGVLAANPSCYNVGWNGTGWYATEKWSTEEERLANNCKKITRAQVSWSCSCAQPSPTPSSTATPSASMEPEPSPSPESLPSVTPVPCILEPSPVPTPSVAPRPTPTPDTPGLGGTTDDEDEEVIEETEEPEEVYAETGLPSDLLLAFPGFVGLVLSGVMLKKRN